ncbi:MAG: hypothetical protein CVU43_03465 [Chloroflexi bacterium HGW-Chloroflexi-5]|jgi:poly-gamma-glutamate synthesis protein (capsule biosynthesis protein)|nr:MAG: hypothetical protein CVU43_03465 [Chloroflexi bacterium HGW-Chloroflexi-5]
MQKIINLFGVLFFTLFLSSCSTLNNGQVHSMEEIPIAQTEATPILASGDITATATPYQPDPKPEGVYFGFSVPHEWIQDVGTLKVTDDANAADLILDLPGRPDVYSFAQFRRIYAVGAPFDTVLDNIALTELQALWSSGIPTSTGYQQLYVTEDTNDFLTHYWGFPFDSSFKVIDKQTLVSELWSVSNALAILPFEEIEPRLKILRVDGISPLDRPMDVENYGLTITYFLSGSQDAEQRLQPEIEQIKSLIPATNRDESKMTVVMMTGTTALARVTLKKIELNGYEYPVEMIKDWFLSADLRHVSNEVSFMEGCKYVDAYTMQFCSKPDQIAVLENIGVNVVESTGNHMNDYPGDAFAKTLEMYQDRGWLSFGGGFNQEAALQPATTEVNGNKIAFIGCNPVGFETAWATDTRAGSAKCEYEWMNQKIAELKAEGYVVITTFQAWEIDRLMYDEVYRKIFKDAANAGADIVQGSQAHAPMGFEFINNSLIHYGLGNFLFDQMEPHNIREFYDRHIIYNGKYINTELLTATLMDWSRPVPMTEQDRQALLDEIFTASKMRKK